jgi:spore coat polysaccharide biosynthesis predicted glycosyltransferase SpsG/RimJ/RimL family protein N-acetyltransferase
MSEMINIAIRVDANATLGTGHFGRVAAVYNALSVYEDLQITLLINPASVVYVSAYFPDGTDYIILSDDGQSAAAAIAQLGDHPDVIYMDHYGDVSMWESACQAAHIPLVVFDDLDEAQDAPMVFRSIPSVVSKSNTGFVYEGAAFIPLSKRGAQPERTHGRGVLRVNVCFGGSDPTGETLKLFDVLSSIDDMVFDVVIGPGNPMTTAEQTKFESVPHIQCHRAPSPEKLTQLMTEADLALGAGGVMQWERLYLGLPSLVITVAENQKPQIDWMHAQGLLQLIGDHETISPNNVRQALCAFRDEHDARSAMSQKGMALVDGRGAIRIAAGIRSLALSVRPVEITDARDLLDWRTHEFNWKFNFSTADKPEYDFHVDWLAMKLVEPECMYIIIEQGDVPISVVRFDVTPEGNNARLSIYLVPDQHGKKLGLAVYMAAEQALRAKYPSLKGVFSYIHVTNFASQRLHKDAGFDLSASTQKDIMLDANRYFNLF